MIRRALRGLTLSAAMVGMLAAGAVSASAYVPDENHNASCVGYSVSWVAQHFNLGQEAIPSWKDGTESFGRDVVRHSARAKPSHNPEDPC